MGASASGIDELYTFSVSQDHVESSFACIRQMGGNNCNPNAQQFAGSYRKLLFRNEVTSSDAANCRNDVTKVLEFSSGTKKLPLSANEAELRMLAATDNDICVVPEPENDELTRHSRAYLASELEKKVNRKIKLRGKNACAQCMNIFNENEKINDKFIYFLSQKRKVAQPCKSSMDIIRILESTLEKHDGEDVSYHSLVAHILNQTTNMPVQLYESTQFENEHDHQLDFIKLIMETYLDVRCTHVSKLVTRLSQKKLLRHHHLKEIHRQGQ